MYLSITSPFRRDSPPIIFSIESGLQPDSHSYYRVLNKLHSIIKKLHSSMAIVGSAQFATEYNWLKAIPIASFSINTHSLIQLLWSSLRVDFANWKFNQTLIEFENYKISIGIYWMSYLNHAVKVSFYIRLSCKANLSFGFTRWLE